MKHALPPLNTLRVFEAAARHLSFTRAAEELNVTQAAVSHQIKALEERLGITLFKRMNRALMLTDAGQAYYPAIREAIDAIRQATERLYELESTGTLTVTMLASFAAKWLVPRLGRFRARCPDIDVLLSTSSKLIDFQRDDVDIGIRYGAGEWPNIISEKLFSEDLFPVCSPALLDGAIPLREPADLAHHMLLQDAGMDWRTWLIAAGIGDVELHFGTSFIDSSLALQAAMAGQGVALGRMALVADDLAAGRLVRPFQISLPSNFAYYIVCSVHTGESPKIKAFSDWLKDEARNYENDLQVYSI
ncbi:transcriptional regulator GcvA [Alphaproteobacteria bacterium HT1-32]|nr:transcriptional regulator GcvA [Alphaproteobacteria bacterium HT1-32]